MTPKIGRTYLVTTDEWFFAPDGETYKAVFGTVTGIESDKAALGVQTNRHSTNWYLSIGNMMIAGCQIHYCIQTDWASDRPPAREMEHEGELVTGTQSNTRIYFADT